MWLFLLFITALLLIIFFLLLYIKKIHIWFIDYLIGEIKNVLIKSEPKEIYFMFADHFEPYGDGGKTPTDKARSLVQEWLDKYPDIAKKYVDSNGNHPCHTFFYPEEQYDEKILDMLKNICNQGIGDIEIHLHHDNDTEEGLTAKLNYFKKILHERHGLLRKDKENGKIIYGFIHGNWALCNSGKDGRLCGVNNELTVLKKTGCYADFTLPSAPSETQTAKINSIYYATQKRGPKSHNRGVDVETGQKPTGTLLIIQGILGLSFSKRKYGLLPRIESGEIASHNPFLTERLKVWLRHCPRVRGAEHIGFIKIFTHGAQEKNLELLLNDNYEYMLRTIEKVFLEKKIKYYYVSAYKMFRKIKELESIANG